MENKHLEALNSNLHKFDWNAYAMNRFSIAKTAIPAYASLSEQIVKELYNLGSTTVEELSKRIKVKKGLIEDCLYYLKIRGFIIYHAYLYNPYSLSELGRILAKQLN